MIDKYTSFFSRLFFVVAIIILLLAVWDRIIGLFGWTITWLYYQPGRLLEFSAILIIFVIALLLRQIRQELRKETKS